MTLNDSDLEKILQSCQQSPIAWLQAYGIYVFYTSMTVMNLVLFCFSVMSFADLVHRCYREYDVFLYEHEENTIESDLHYFYGFVFQRLVVICLYVFGAFVYHSMVSDRCVTLMLVARWWIEATVDIHLFVVLTDAVWKLFIDFGGYRLHLEELSDMLLIIKIHQFGFFRYTEFHPESAWNSLLAVIFRHSCISSHFARSSDWPIFTFIVRFGKIEHDLPALVNRIRWFSASAH